MSSMKTRKVSLMVMVAVALVGCSFSTGTTPQAAGEKLIEGVLGEQSGLVYLDATCLAPAANEVGETFTCTATTDDGAAVTFQGVVDPDDMIFVAPSNIIDAGEMSIVEAEAAEVLGAEVGATIDPSDVDCPDVSTVLIDDRLRCEITDTATGDRYEMYLTATDFVLREGYGSRAYAIGDQLN
jgi:hypothetical protein